MGRTMIEERLFEELCEGCYRAKKCHETCDYCDNFLKELESNKENKNDKNTQMGKP